MYNDPFDQLQLFRGLDPAQRDSLRSLFATYLGTTGTVIFEQGEVAEYLYLVLEGEVIVRFKPDDGPPLIIAHIRPGGVVGWSAALGSPSYTSSAVCSMDCRMLRIKGADLRAYCMQFPGAGSVILDRLATVVSQRLQKTHDQVIALLEQGMRMSVPDH